MIPVILCSLLVGFLCGATSVGGVLLIPALVYCLNMDIHLASGTALCSFFFTAIFGTWQHGKNGRLRREYVVPMAAGGIICGCIGAVVNYMTGSGVLNVVLAWIIMASGMTALRPMRAGAVHCSGKKSGLLFSIGSFVGFMAGLTGVGGPVLSVPMMIALGFDSRLSIAAALPLQLACCFSGSLGNLFLGQIDWPLALLTVVIQTAGFYAGLKAAGHTDASFLRKSVAFLCIGTGILMLWG